MDAFLCSFFIFSRRRRTRVVRCWSIRLPETSTAVCRGYIGTGASSISLETSTSSGETWFQPRLVDWNGGTDSRCFRMRLCRLRMESQLNVFLRFGVTIYKLTLGVSVWPWPGWFGLFVLPIAQLHHQRHQWHS